MKAFVVVALLVASVASQSMDMWRPTTHRLSTFDNLLMKEKWGHGLNSYNFDVTDDVDSIYGMDKTYRYTIEELFNHPLFREYMQLPLFAQMWEEHPVAFRRYVESPLFQRFWTVPQFQMYFRNPAFFYKYIVPQIKMFTTTTTTEGIYGQTQGYGFYPTQSKHMPYIYSRYNNFNNDWSIPMTKPTPFNFYPTTTTSTYQKYLLEKMMSHMKTIDTHTDVKMLPNGQVKEQTWGKIVDPVSGEERITVGDIKLVNEKIVPRDFQGLEESHVYDKNVLLKHIILNKILGNKVIRPEVYEALFGDVIRPEMYKYKTSLNIPEMMNTIYGREHHKLITPEMYETINKHVLTPEILESIFGQKVYHPEVYGILFGEHGIDTTPYYLRNKMISPLVSRMLYKNDRPLPTYYGKMDMLKKIQLIDEIKKEKMMEELLVKEHRPTTVWDHTEYPKTEERYSKVPLTFGKPVVGSGIEEFEIQKEMF